MLQRHFTELLSTTEDKYSTQYKLPANLAHNVGEYGSRRSNQCTNNCHEIVVQHEALSTQSPARVAVQHGDHNWHVSTYNATLSCYYIIHIMSQ